MRPLNFLNLFLFVCLASCSAKVSSGGGDNGPAVTSSPDVKVGAEALRGTVDGKNWSLTSAVAIKNPEGEMEITISGDPTQGLTCDNWFLSTPTLQFTVPIAPGTYGWRSSNPVSGARLVNFVFPYRTPTGGGADAIISDSSLIRIDSISSQGLVRGGVAAVSPGGVNHTYDISGTFEVMICTK